MDFGLDFFVVVWIFFGLEPVIIWIFSGWNQWLFGFFGGAELMIIRTFLCFPNLIIGVWEFVLGLGFWEHWDGRKLVKLNVEISVVSNSCTNLEKGKAGIGIVLGLGFWDWGYVGVGFLGGLGLGFWAGYDGGETLENERGNLCFASKFLHKLRERKEIKADPNLPSFHRLNPKTTTTKPETPFIPQCARIPFSPPSTETLSQGGNGCPCVSGTGCWCVP